VSVPVSQDQDQPCDSPLTGKVALAATLSVIRAVAARFLSRDRNSAQCRLDQGRVDDTGPPCARSSGLTPGQPLF
jgi:hypothetical protein